MRPHELEITPEPSPEERAAIEAALVGLLARQGKNHNAWWHAGLHDAVDDDEDRA